MSSKRLKTRRGKKKVESEDSEVFVLPPHLLEKLGINLSAVNNTDLGCLEKLNHQKGMEQQEDNVKTETIANKQKNTSEDSSIIATADLMTKSVFLSPTFSLPITFETTADDIHTVSPTQSVNPHAGEICTPNIIDFIDYHTTGSINDPGSSGNINFIPEIAKSGDNVKCDISNSVNINEQRKSDENIQELELYEDSLTYSHKLISPQDINDTTVVADNHNDEAYLSDYSNSNPEKSELLKPVLNVNKNKINIISQEIFGPNNLKEILSNSNFSLIENNALPITLTDLLSLKEDRKKVPETKPLQHSTNSVNVTKNDKKKHKNAAIRFGICESSIDEKDMSVSCSNWESKHNDEIEINDKILDKYARQFLSDEKVLIEIVDKFNDCTEELKEYDNTDLISEIQLNMKCGGPENMTNIGKNTLACDTEYQTRISIDILNQKCSDLIKSTASNMVMLAENTFNKNTNPNLNKKNTNIITHNDSFLNSLDSKDSGINQKRSIDIKTGNTEMINEIASYLVNYADKLAKRRNNLPCKDKNEDLNVNVDGVSKLNSQGVEKPGGYQKLVNKVYSNKTKRNVQKIRNALEKPLHMLVMEANDSRHSLENNNLLVSVGSNNGDGASSFCICEDFGSLRFYECGNEYNHIHFYKKRLIPEIDGILEERDFCEYVENNLNNTYCDVDNNSTEDSVMDICWNKIELPDNIIVSAADLNDELKLQSTINEDNKDIKFGKKYFQASTKLENPSCQNLNSRIISPTAVYSLNGECELSQRRCDLNIRANYTKGNEVVIKRLSNETANNDIHHATLKSVTSENTSNNAGSTSELSRCDEKIVKSKSLLNTHILETNKHLVMGKTKRNIRGNKVDNAASSANIKRTDQDEIISSVTTASISLPKKLNHRIIESNEPSFIVPSNEICEENADANNSINISDEDNSATIDHPNKIEDSSSIAVRKSTRAKRKPSLYRNNKIIANVPIKINETARKEKRSSLLKSNDKVYDTSLVEISPDEHLSSEQNMALKSEDIMKSPNELPVDTCLKTCHSSLRPFKTKIKLSSAKCNESSEDKPSEVVTGNIKHTMNLNSKEHYLQEPQNRFKDVKKYTRQKPSNQVSKTNYEFLESSKESINVIEKSTVMHTKSSKIMSCLESDNDENKISVTTAVTPAVIEDTNDTIDVKINEHTLKAPINIKTVRSKRLSNVKKNTINGETEVPCTTNLIQPTEEHSSHEGKMVPKHIFQYEKIHVETTQDSKQTVASVDTTFTVSEPTTTVKKSPNSSHESIKKVKRLSRQVVDSNIRPINRGDTKLHQVDDSCKISYERIDVAQNINTSVDEPLPNISSDNSRFLKGKRESVRKTSKGESNKVPVLENTNVSNASVEKLQDKTPIAIKKSNISKRKSSLVENSVLEEIISSEQAKKESLHSPGSSNRPGRKRKSNCHNKTKSDCNITQGEVLDKSADTCERVTSGSDDNDDISLADVKKSKQVEVLKTETDVSHGSDNAVVCGLCQININENEWISHIAKTHNYLAWKSGEPVMDLEDEKAKYNHLKQIIKIVDLVCKECGRTRKTVAGFLSHLGTCRARKEAPACKDTEEQDVVTCAVCRKKVDSSDWSSHAMSKHYNLAWREGEEPINLKNVYVLEKYLKQYQRIHKKFDCRVCGGSRASAIGFYAHYITCGKTEEEISPHREQCDVCQQQYLSIYRQQHMAVHRNKETKQQQQQQQQSLLNQKKDALKPDPDDDETADVSSRRRLAAQRANRTIERLRAKEASLLKCPACGQRQDDAAELRAHRCGARDADAAGDSDSDTDTDGSSGVDEDEEETRQPRRKNKAKVNRVPFVVQNPNKYIAQAAKDFEAHHLTDADLFPWWRAAAPEPLSAGDAARYLPGVAESCRVRGGDGDWTTYRRFETKLMSGVWSLFAGGCIESVCWAPARLEGGGEGAARQYLAVATHGGPDQPRLDAARTYAHPGLIQIWDFGELDDATEPKLVLALAHDNGTAWSMDWCPSGARDLPGELPSESAGSATGPVPRLGLLAVAFSNGRVFIYAVPYPDASDRASPLVYRAAPAAELRWSDACTSQATALRWSKQKGHSHVHVGYSDGSCGAFAVASRSPLVRARLAGRDVLRPSREERLHETCVTGLDVFPSAGAAGPAGAAVCSSSASRGRLQGAAGGCHVARRPLARAAFAPHWPAAVFCGFDLLAEELELYGAGRRAGGLTAAAACARCGLSARAAPPALRVGPLHPAHRDAGLLPIATIEMKPLAQKRPARADDVLVVVPELRYEDAVRKYGVQFTARHAKAGEAGIPKAESCVFPDRFPLADVTSMQFAPGAHHRRLAVGLHCGVLLLLHV